MSVTIICYAFVALCRNYNAYSLGFFIIVKIRNFGIVIAQSYGYNFTIDSFKGCILTTLALCIYS